MEFSLPILSEMSFAFSVIHVVYFFFYFELLQNLLVTNRIKFYFLVIDHRF